MLVLPIAWNWSFCTPKATQLSLSGESVEQGKEVGGGDRWNEAGLAKNWCSCQMRKFRLLIALEIAMSWVRPGFLKQSGSPF